MQPATAATGQSPDGDRRAELARLSRAASTGDEVAFRALVHKTTPTVYRLALHLTRSQSDAEDVVQETFVRVWRGLDSLSEHDAVLGWICRIVRNQVIDRARAASRRPRLLSRPTQAVLAYFRTPDPAPSPEDAAALSQAGDLVLNLIDELREEYRIVLRLRWLEGLSTREIAVALDCPEGTVDTRTHRGRVELANKVRRMLGSAGEKP